MSLGVINIPADPVKKKGGLLGAIANIAGDIIGGAGAIAAPFTGGASLAATGAGAALSTGAKVAKAAQGIGSLISGVGGALGSVADPAAITGGGKPTPVQPIEVAAKSRLSQDPTAQVAQLNESLSALKQQDPQIQKAMEPYFVTARDRILQRIG